MPGGIAAESLTFTPLEDMIFLKWEEPQEPNGLITQYEVNRGPGGRWEVGGQSSFLCCDREVCGKIEVGLKATSRIVL